jgi:hypothetical protein
MIVADEHMGAAGLVSYGGKARFRYVVLGEVDWTPDPIKKSKQNRQVTKEFCRIVFNENNMFF